MTSRQGKKSHSLQTHIIRSEEYEKRNSAIAHGSTGAGACPRLGFQANHRRAILKCKIVRSTKFVEWWNEETSFSADGFLRLCFLFWLMMTRMFAASSQCDTVEEGNVLGSHRRDGRGDRLTQNSRTLQPHDDRDFEMKLRRGVDDAFCDDVTTHNAAKNIYQDSFHLQQEPLG